MHQDPLNNGSLTGNQRPTAPALPDGWCLTSDGKSICRHQYRRHVGYLASRLPDARFALNLCRDRYAFLVAFHAIALKGQTNLLPPNQAPATLRELIRRYADSYIVCDTPPISDLGAPVFQVELVETISGIGNLYADAEVTPGQVAAILFTSGTSGRPTAIHKCWRELQAGVRLIAKRFGLDGKRNGHLLATVPPTHMFGLETSVMLPLTCGTGFHSGQPLFPEDIRRALRAAAPGRPVLITTPIHLKACVESGLHWRNTNCELIISATAPLHAELAGRAEQQFCAPVKEIYGSTETGALASRRTTDGDEWRFYPTISAQPYADGFTVSGGHLPRPCRMSDRILVQSDGRFKLLGRHSDMIKLAGKRTSLAELNLRLNQIVGVVDGAFIDTAEPDCETRRLAAAVVAPSLDRARVLAALAEWIDPVFLPRPLLFLDALPRNESGKLPQQALRDLIP